MAFACHASGGTDVDGERADSEDIMAVHEQNLESPEKMVEPPEKTVGSLACVEITVDSVPSPKASSPSLPRMSSSSSMLSSASRTSWQRSMTLEEKGQEVRFRLWAMSTKEWKHSLYSLDLRRELACSVYWTGNFCKDFLFFVCNCHPLVGLFCRHPMHPYTLKERYAAVFVEISLIVTLCTFVARPVERQFDTLDLMSFTAVDWILWLSPCYLSMIAQALLYRFAVASYFRGGRYKWGLFRVLLLAAAVGLVGWWAALRQEPDEDVGEQVMPCLRVKAITLVAWFVCQFLAPCGYGFTSQWRREREELSDELQQ